MNDLDLGLRHDDDPRTRAAGHARHRQSRGPRGRRWGVALVGLGLALAVFAVGVTYGAKAISGLLTVADYSGQGSGSVRVQVKAGESSRSIASTLAAADVVKSSEAFRNAAEADPKSRSIQPGTYQLHKQMSGAAALALMLAPHAKVQSSVTIPEGLTVEQTLTRLHEGSHLSMAKLRAAAAKPSTLGLPSWADGHVEGYLYPSTYEIEPTDSATDVLTAMVDQFNQTAGEVELLARAKAYKESPAQMVITASLIERESRVRSDDAKISRVIRNRLIAGQPLQVDAAVLYGVGKAGQGTAPTEADLQSKSPYNVYKIKGLPPTAIASPGKPALQAALAPADGDWLYYVRSDKAGHHYFTSSYKDFLAHKAAAKKAGIF